MTSEKTEASQKSLLKNEAQKAIGLIIEDLCNIDDSLCNTIRDYFKLGHQDDNACERAHSYIQGAIGRLSHLRYDDLVQPVREV